METRGSYKWHSKSPGERREAKPSRRIVLATALAPLLRGQGADISNFDLSLLDEPVVPADLFFIRNHFPVPTVSAAGWKLAITGAVSMPVEISVQDLSAS